MLCRTGVHGILAAIVLVPGALLLHPRGAGATIVHWNNSAGGSWSTTANWSPAIVPNQFDDVLIDLAGTYTISASGPITIKSLTMGASSGVQTLQGSGTITANGISALAGTQTGVLATATLAGTGSLTVNAGSTLTLRTCTVNLPVTNSGTLVLAGTGTMNGAYTGGAGTTLRLLGSSGNGSSIQTFANGFTNNGTLELTSSGGVYATILNVTSGSLINAPTRTIDVQAGSGGVRTFGLQLDNQGTLNVGAALTLELTGSAHVNSGTINVTGGDLAVKPWSGSLTNNGTINVAAGRTLTVSGGSFQHVGGSISGAGALALNIGVAANLATTPGVSAMSVAGSTLTLGSALNTGVTALDASSSTLNGPGTITNAAAETLSIQTCTVNAPLVNNGTLVLKGTGNVNGGYTSGVGSGLRLWGMGGAGSSIQAFASGFTNNGSIEMNSFGGVYAAIFNVTSGTLVNAASRTIDVLAGTGGVRTFGLQLDNQGTLNVGAALTLEKTGSAHSNSGTINVTGGDLAVKPWSGSFTNTGSIGIGSSRTLTVSGGSLQYPTGYIGGNGTLALDQGVTANLTATPGVLAMTVSGATVALNDVLNTGVTLLTASSSTFNGPGVLTNPLGITLTLKNCAVNKTVANYGTLVLTGTGSISGSYFSGPGSTLRLLGASGAGSSIQTIANGFVNDGTIELTSTGGIYAAILNVTSGTLVNAPLRTIDVQAGSGGTRTLGAQIDNQGTLIVGAALNLDRTSAVHSNSGILSVSGGDLTVIQSGTTPGFNNNGILDVANARKAAFNGGAFVNGVLGTLSGKGTFDVTAATFSQKGTIRPGTGTGILKFLGPIPKDTTAKLFVDIGGLTAGSGFDRVVASGALTLKGSLDLALANGFTPVAGQTFPILAGASRTGSFAAITGMSLGGGLALEPVYSDTGLAVQAVSRSWVPVSPSGTPPAARDGHTAVFDAASHRMIVFGGTTDAGPANDVWVLTNADGTGGPPSWVALAPTGTPPAPRRHHVAVYDPGSNRMIVFGGDNAAGTPTVFGDVRVLSNANGMGGTPTWGAVSVAGGPGPRTGAAAVYDASSKRLVVFGGSATGACGVASNDVWVLTNADGNGTPSWTALAPTGTPPSARAFARAGYDAANNRMIVFSGLSPCGVESNGAWALTRATGLGGAPAWVPLTAVGTPPAAASLQAAVYDPAADRFMVFGGTSGGVLQGTLACVLSAGGIAASPIWLVAQPAGSAPSARKDASAIQATGSAVLFGGMAGTGRSNEVFALQATATGVVGVPEPEEPVVLPQVTAFARPAWPNPSRGDVQFAVDVAREQQVGIMVCDVAGRRLAVLQSGALPAGRHVFAWDGRTEAGAQAPSGVYFIRMDAEDAHGALRIMRMR